AEETLVSWVVVHITDRVNVYAERDEGHDHQHQRTQTIYEKAYIKRERAADSPTIHVHVEAPESAPDRQVEHIHRKTEGGEHRRDRDRVRKTAVDLVVADENDRRSRQRREQNDEEYGLDHVTLSFQAVDFFNVDTSPIAEEHDE